MTFFFAFVPILILVMLNTGNSSGYDEGQTDYAGMHGAARRAERDGTVAYNGVEMIEGQNVGTGNNIDNGAGLDEDDGPGIGTGAQQRSRIESSPLRHSSSVPGRRLDCEREGSALTITKQKQQTKNMTYLCLTSFPFGQPNLCIMTSVEWIA